MALTAGGIGSGLDIDGLISQLLAAEAQPATTRLAQREARLQSRLSAFGQFQSALDQLRQALAGLTSTTSFNSRTATVADPTLLGASADASAAAGGYSIEVIRLAVAHKLASAPVAAATSTVGHGTLTISAGGTSFDVVIDSGTPALADIRNAINSAPDNSLVTATLVTANDGVRLVLTARSTGADNALTVTQSGGDGGLAALVYDPGGGGTSLTELQAATDAQIRVDGFTLDSPGNVITEAATGLTLTLLAAAPGSPTTLTVDNDREASAEKVQDFVAAYNSALQALRGLAQYDAASRSAGPLQGDATLRGFLGTLRSTVVQSVTGAGGYAALYDIGVTTAVDGSLQVDEAKLGAALAAGYDDVGRLFGTETTGLAVRLDQLLGEYLDSDGLIATRTAGLQDGIRDLDQARAALDRRLEQVERRLRSQFSALDALVAQFQSTGDFLARQLANLNTQT